MSTKRKRVEEHISEIQTHGIDNIRFAVSVFGFHNSERGIQDQHILVGGSAKDIASGVASLINDLTDNTEGFAEFLALEMKAYMIKRMAEQMKKHFEAKPEPEPPEPTEEQLNGTNVIDLLAVIAKKGQPT